MIALIGWFITPIGRIVGMALAIVTILGGIYWKITSDAVSGERSRVKEENTNAVTNARSASDAASDNFDRDPANGVPNDQLRD